ncbi:hypothetical protein GC167_05395 [bacterium]|nr:hypothetical protein [bacterium]
MKRTLTSLVKIFSAFLLLLSSISARASHLYGGELWWDCLPNGQMVFKMRLYRDCNGITLNSPTETLTIRNYPNGFSTTTTVAMFLINSTDLSPACTSFPGALQLDCGNMNVFSGGNGLGAIQENYYESQPFSFAPNSVNPGGHIVTWNLCCRPYAVSNLVNPGSLGYTLRTIIYPRLDPATNTYTPLYPCADNAPRFSETPIAASVAGVPKMIYNNNAFDTEFDSLFYRWDIPLDNLGYYGSNPWNPVPFALGYSYNNPLPGPSVHPLNTGANLNNQNGAVDFTNYTLGSFVTTLAVESWRGNQKVAEIFRDIVINNVPDSSNQAPVIDVVAYPGTPTVTGTGPYYEVTASIGDTIALIWIAQDGDSIPVIQQPQTLNFSAFGMLVDTVFDGGASNLPCLTPPCPYWVSDTAATGLFQSQDSLRVGFVWIPDSTHLGGPAQNTQWTFDHHFVVRFSDNQCPIPAYSYAYLTVHLLNPNHPRLHPDDNIYEAPRDGSNLIALGGGDYALHTPWTGPVRIQICDMGGRIHYTGVLEHREMPLQLPSGLAKGVYLLNVESLTHPGQFSRGKWIQR